MIASSFALACFAAACLFGAAAGNEVTVIIGRATAAMLACYFVGLAVGAVAQRTVEDHIASYKAKHPLDVDADPSSPSTAAQAGGDPVASAGPIPGAPSPAGSMTRAAGT